MPAHQNKQPKHIETHPPIDTQSVLQLVENSDEYRQEIADGQSRNRALARAGLHAAGVSEFPAIEELPDKYDVEDLYHKDDVERSQESDIYALVGNIQSFTHGIEGLRHLRRKRAEGWWVDSEQTDTLKARAVKFNHVLRHLMEDNPALKANHIEETVTGIYEQLNSGRWSHDPEGWDREKSWFAGEVAGLVRAMQQEYLAEQFAEEIKKQMEVEGKDFAYVTDVSVEDELKGVDAWVTLDGVTFPIDIKSNQTGVDSARKKEELYAKNRKRPAATARYITTDVESKDMRGTFRMSRRNRRKHTPDFLAKLYAARAEYIRLNPGQVTEEQPNYSLAT